MSLFGVFLIPKMVEDMMFSPIQETISLEGTSFGTFTNASAISDDALGWNNGDSTSQSIALDSLGNLHVVWTDNTVGAWGSDEEIMYCNYTEATGWSNATVISDDETGWNTGNSFGASIAIDDLDVIHVVWSDSTVGAWGSDYEIMYCNYTFTSGWSNATVISDDENLWNDGLSNEPDIAVDSSGAVHVVWDDNTVGAWGSDIEIMYCNYTSASGWSNATVISDDVNAWNTDYSRYASVAVNDSGIVHVVWQDATDGAWGIDTEIMYCNYSATTGWSNASVISDSIIPWNNQASETPEIAVSDLGILHVVWADDTSGAWGTDKEIMYSNYTEAKGWSNATVISDDSTGWNNGISINPSIAVNGSGILHVVWADSTVGTWGSDLEIMYCNYTSASGWSNATVISDDVNVWNNEMSNWPSIAVNGSGTVHVAWSDDTNGAWGSDWEILYSNYTVDISGGSGPELGPGTPPIPGFEIVFIMLGLLSVIIIYMRKNSKPRELITF